MKRSWFGVLAAGFAVLFSVTTALAQSTTWVQIEARPTEGEAIARAEAYSARLGTVSGFALNTGWYGIVLGPFPRDEAALRLSQLRSQGLIPRDSFLADGSAFVAPFWPLDGAETPLRVEETAPAPAVPLQRDDETLAEARASEGLLTRDERAELQEALAWEGFYRSTIDAAFGRGTRAAMAAWQSANGFEATGVLTSFQRQELLAPRREAFAALGIEAYRDAEAGIDIALPLGLLEFDGYQSPFAQFSSAEDPTLQVLLISQRGDAASLAGLYEVMQGLEIMPLDGQRALDGDRFTLTGQDETRVSHVFAEVIGDSVKGYGLIWPSKDEERRRIVLQAMQTSFAATSAVLPDTAGSAAQSVDLLAGLALRTPDLNRSGFYVDTQGRVLTTSAAVASCSRITLNDSDMTATVLASDPALGLALLEPDQTVSPLAIASFATSVPRLQSEIAVSGFSFGGALGSPTMTYGVLADLRGLDGDPMVERLSLTAQESDSGGPVFEPSGTILGMLVDEQDSARVLPVDVSFAADASVIADFLRLNGVEPTSGTIGNALHPLDLATKGADLTVLVSCWR